MRAIYEPQGRAREYSALAINLHSGCEFACSYCFGPGCMRQKPSDFHTNVTARKDILEAIEKDCKKLRNDPREILLCFLSDPYQDLAPEHDVTRLALLILARYGMKATVLTKGGTRAIRDFDILKKNNWRFGTTLVFHEDRTEWEPHAATVADRKAAIVRAKLEGIKTWVSVEPVINPDSALSVIHELLPVVDHWKIGKVNHMPMIEQGVDWKKFLRDVEALLRGKDYYIKADLEKFR